MEEFCKALHVVNEATGEVDTWGFLLLEDTSFIQGGLLWSTGSPLVAEGGTSPALENKSLLRLFSDWRRWVDEGWCKPYAPTNASAECTELFYRGKLAAFITSCGSLGNIKKFAAENGFELGVSYLPDYDEPPTGSGGGIAPVTGSAQQCVQELLPACGVVRVRDADTRAAALCRPHLGQERTAVAVRMDDVIAAVPHDAGKPGCIGDGVSIPHGQHEHAPAQAFHACAKVCVRFVDRNNVRQEALPRRFHGGKRIGGDAVRRKARRQDFKCANLPFHCPNAFNSSGA